MMFYLLNFIKNKIKKIKNIMEDQNLFIIKLLNPWSLEAIYRKIKNQDYLNFNKKCWNQKIFFNKIIKIPLKKLKS